MPELRSRQIRFFFNLLHFYALRSTQSLCINPSEYLLLFKDA
jgi:hypothetical protein